MSIGNFYNDQNTQFTLLPGGVLDFAYYYIDDVSIIDCTVGLEEMNELNIQILPNPATSQIKISLPNSNAFDLEVYDITGKLVYKNHEQPDDDHVLISTIDFADGFYMLRYVQGVSSGSSKFVIQH